MLIKRMIFSVNLVHKPWVLRHTKKNVPQSISKHYCTSPHPLKPILGKELGVCFNKWCLWNCAAYALWHRRRVIAYSGALWKSFIINVAFTSGTEKGNLCSRNRAAFTAAAKGCAFSKGLLLSDFKTLSVSLFQPCPSGAGLKKTYMLP